MHKLTLLRRVTGLAVAVGLLALAWTAVASPNLQSPLAACSEI